jgi:threonylcarbamoyladenosine tRNA methylthiotransferase MtaB
VAVVSLGCRVGRADAGSLVAALGPGFRPAVPGEGVEWVVVATCSVTSDAASTSRQAVRRAAREHPGARIVVAGCHAAMEESVLAGFPGVAAVVPPRDHAALPGILARLRAGEEPGRAASGARSAAPAWDAPADPASGPARAVLKVQDGCDEDCAYCTVPLARGAARSLPPGEALARIAAAGRVRPEVVLSGVDLGAWGGDLAPAASLADLLRAAARSRAVHRIRISSIEPLDLPLDLLGEEEGGILCEHFHLPMQSGSDRVLAAMGRPYRAADYARVVEAAVRALPDAAIGADVMCGFPGETEADHRATIALLAGLPVAYLHVFPFSPRPGTRAAGMDGRPPAEDVLRRAAELRALSGRRQEAFLGGLAGRELEVVVERVVAGRARGTSREYAAVSFPAGGTVRCDVVRVRGGGAGVDLGRGVARAGGSA